jgi:uncharacterized protein YgiB involved in biofilm formation
MRRRATLQISLVLVGLVTMTGCGEKQQRSVYKNRQDCLDDWGGNDKDCQQPPQGSQHYGTGFYYGPHYGGSYRPSRSVGVTSVSRGGFGSIGHFFSSGG